MDLIMPETYITGESFVELGASLCCHTEYGGLVPDTPDRRSFPDAIASPACQPLDFSDYDPTHIPPLLRIPFPDGTVYQTAFDTLYWKTISWYFLFVAPLF